MEQNDDLWLKQWKEVLDDFEEEVPVDGWEKLQADLQANDPVRQENSPQSAKVIPFRRWQVAAAAAVVALVAGAGIWFLASEAPQVPIVEDPIAQILQTEKPNEPGVGGQTQQMIINETVSEEEMKEEKPEQTSVSTKTVVANVSVDKPVEKTKPTETKPVKAEETQQPVVTQIAAQQAENAVQQVETKTEEVESKRKGTPIQVKNTVRDQKQRSITPVYVGDRQTTSEVNVNNRRKQVQVSNDPALQNVPLLRNGEATTRSMASEITDMDRVFNSFIAHYDELYNSSAHLFDNGTGVYSTVDNALFMAGLVKKMQGGQRTNDDVKLYREMANSLVNLQQSNGLWKENLLNSASRSADIDADSYICYALAWGINNGILNRNQYLESVRRAWNAIGNCNSEACQLAAHEIKKL